MDLIRQQDFVKVITDRLAADGIDANDTLYVVGLKALPVSEEDPYTQRIKLFVHQVVKNHVVPDKLYAIDPASVEKVSPLKQKKLLNIVRQDFAEVG